MKKRIAAIMMLFCCVSTMSADTSKIKGPFQKEITLYQASVWVKEYLYTIFILPWWIDNKKAEAAKVYCNQCGHCMNSLDTYGYLVGHGETKKITKLKRLWHTGSIQEIEQFLLKVHELLQLQCIPCLAYHSWHILPTDQK